MRYTREDGCRAWLTYGQLNVDLVSALLETFGSAEAVYDQFCQQGGDFLSKYASETSIETLRQRASKNAMHEMMVTMQRMNIGILGIDDIHYPDLLRTITSPPALLFYRGNIDCLLGKHLTAIGSRRASVPGIETTQRVCQELSQAGVSIVSGLAIGIDAAAHEGCLQGGSPTIAVMASGIDVDYPAENTRLKEKIVQQGGLLLSEYPLGARPGKHVFQQRNRILSGLSMATMVMEAGPQSGCMLTVNHALDQGREVFVFPGNPDGSWNAGGRKLLREGARCFYSAQDMLEDMSWEATRPTLSDPQKQELPPLTDEQRKLYTLLSQGELSFDQLAAESELSTPELSSSLTMLQMQGLVRAMPGKCYIRN